MVSVNTYSSATNAGVRALREIDQAMKVSQTRIATGSKVNSSSDDPALYAIASSLRSEISQDVVKRDALANAATTATIAGFSLSAVSDILTLMSEEVSNAIGKDSAGKAASQARVKLLKDQLVEVVASGYNGKTNLLDGSTTTFSAGGLSSDVSGLAMRTSGGTGILDKAGTNFAGASILTLDVSMLSDADLAKVAADVTKAQDATGLAKSRLGSMESMFDGQSDFLATMIGIKEKATEDLTAADPDEEAAKIAALAVRREFVLEMLQSVRESQRSILRLFDN